MSLEIVSHTGVGALRFGMSPEQVHAILGSPRFTRIDPGHLRETYGANPALTYTGIGNDLKLVEIGFVKPAGEVMFRGLNLFGDECAVIINRLCSDDPDPMDVAGTLVFRKLGISLTGFHTGHVASLSVTVFAPGTWDTHLGESKRSELPAAHIECAATALPCHGGARGGDTSIASTPCCGVAAIRTANQRFRMYRSRWHPFPIDQLTKALLTLTRPLPCLMHSFSGRKYSFFTSFASDQHESFR